MNNYFIFFCLLFSSFVIAQPSMTDLQRDTAEANRFYFESETLDYTNTRKIDLLKQAIALYHKHNFINQTIQIQGVLAYHYLIMDSEEVVTIGRSAIELAKEEFQSDTIADLGNIYWILQTYWYNNDYKQSIYFGEQALKTLPKYSYIYYNTAYMLLSAYIGNSQISALERLRDKLEREIEIMPSDVERPINAMTTSYYGRYLSYIANKNYQYTIKYGQQLLAEIEKNQLESDYNLGEFYIQIGKALGELGQIEEGIDWIWKGIEVEGIEETSPFRGTYYAFIANLYYNKNDFEQATTMMKKAIAAYQLEEENYGSFIRDILSEKAMWHLDNEEVEQALQDLQNAYTYESPNGYLTDLQYGRWLKQQQRFDEALEYLQKAIVATTSDAFVATDPMINPSKYDDFPNKLWIGKALFEKAVTLYEKSKTTQSIETLTLAASSTRLAIQIFIQLHQKMNKYSISRLKTGEDISKSFRVLQSIYELLHQIDPEQYALDDVFQTTEKCKALLLLEIINPSEGQLSKEQRDKEIDLISAIKKLEQEMAFEKEEVRLKDLQNTMFAYVRQMETLQKQISTSFPNHIRNIEYTTYADLSTLQTNIAANAAWLEYSFNHVDNQLLIYVITQKSSRIVTVVVGDLGEDVAFLHQSLKDPFLAMKKKRLEFIEMSSKLYQILIAPIKQDLEGIEQLHIVPDKILFQMPFEVLLPSKEDKSFEDLDYLIKQYVISYHYSATSYITLKDKTTTKDHSLLGFAPVFSNGQSIVSRERSVLNIQDSLYQGLRGDKYQPLPNSKREIETIAQTIDESGHVRLMLEEQATKENLINALTAQSYHFIHIASHGIVNYQNPNYAALVCYQTPKATSSLLFLDEIQMNKIDADLVVLSSCESGVGRLVQGEGAIALNRSFIFAGAKNVLFSLWKVDDKHTSDLMINFYKTYITGKPYADTLRLVKLKMINDSSTALPTYWASFILIGN